MTPSTAKHIGGIAASTVERLADGLVEASQHEAGHVNTDELRAICRLVLQRLRIVAPECPCDCGSAVWHIPGICEQGAAKLKAVTEATR